MINLAVANPVRPATIELYVHKWHSGPENCGFLQNLLKKNICKDNQKHITFYLKKYLQTTLLYITKLCAVD